MDKIQILLAEYGSLRTEVIHRTNNLYQLVAAGAVLFSVAVSRQRIDAVFWITVGLSITVVAAFAFLINRDLDKAARRLRDLELDINTRAGETLMIWETRWGGVVASALGKPRRDSN
jgi:hypothetical protein